MAIQFCKFQETLFRKIVVIDEYYYQLKQMQSFSVTPSIISIFNYNWSRVLMRRP
jgi:hypothetical protein